MDQGRVDSASDASVAGDYAYARQLVHSYFVMLTEGCHRDCNNAHCRSNPQTAALTATEAAIQSIYFATEDPVPLCIELEQQQEETQPPTELRQVEAPAKERASTPEQPQADKENQVEGSVQPSEEPHLSKEELEPETSETEAPKTQQPESVVTVRPIAEASDRKSTPRRRLSIAVQLDNGLNKSREIAKRPTVITRVVVQPKHKSVTDPAGGLSDDVTSTVAETKPTDMPVQQQEQEQTASKAPNPVKDVHQRRLSRPKEKLFDAIKRSFSRSKKAPLGPA